MDRGSCSTGCLDSIRTDGPPTGPRVFKAGALHWPESGVVLREQHNRQAPIVRFVPKVEVRRFGRPFPLPDTTQRGRDAALLVRNGTLRGLSVEFIAEKESHVSGVREITRALLTGAGLVDDPSYSGASVSVRHKAASSNDEDLLRLL